jgi:hypothetical protein
MIMKQELLKQLEIAVEAGIEKYNDQAVDLICAKVEEAIKGKLDDVAIEALKPELKKIVKEALLGLANKIDGVEG